VGCNILKDQHGSFNCRKNYYSFGVTEERQIKNTHDWNGKKI
jgi:hypothetical protein